MLINGTLQYSDTDITVEKKKVISGIYFFMFLNLYVNLCENKLYCFSIVLNKNWLKIKTVRSIVR